MIKGNALLNPTAEEVRAMIGDNFIRYEDGNVIYTQGKTSLECTWFVNNSNDGKFDDLVLMDNDSYLIGFLIPNGIFTKETEVIKVEDIKKVDDSTITDRLLKIIEMYASK